MNFKKSLLLLFLFVCISSFSQLAMYHDFDGDGSGQYFGRSVDINFIGTTFIGGAPSNTTGNYPEGYAMIYEWNGNNWMQKGSRLLGENNYDNFGVSTAIDSVGNRIIVGANENGGNGTKAGHARVFEWDGLSWQQLGSDIDGQASYNELGKSVDISANGQRVAVGAPFHSSNLAQRGHVRILEWSGTNWVDIGQDIRGQNQDDRFGYAVSLSNGGDWVAIGGTYNDNNGSNAGHVRVYQYDGQGWIKRGPDIDGEAAGDQFGYDVSLNAQGNRLIVGAPYNDGNGSDGGHARVYEWNGTSWQQLGQDIDSEGAGDAFGISVSINNLGDKVAIGAVYNNGVLSNSGHVRYYTFDGNNWVQQGSDIDGEASGDSFGRSVSLNGSGSRLVAGANGNDASGNVSGHVRLFSTCGSSANHVITYCGSIDWVDGNTYYSDTTIDFFYMSNTQGCDSVVSLDLTINPLPPVDFSSNTNLISSPPFAFQFNNLTGNLTDYIFNWDFGDGTLLQNNNAIVFHEYSFNGLYDVKLTAQHINTNCIDSLVQTDFVYCTGGPSLSVMEDNSTWKIYPNPINDKVEIHGIIGELRIDIYDSMGNFIKSSNENSIDLTDQPKGTYIVVIDSSHQTNKFVVLKQ